MLDHLFFLISRLRKSHSAVFSSDEIKEVLCNLVDKNGGGGKNERYGVGGRERGKEKEDGIERTRKEKV